MAVFSPNAKNLHSASSSKEKLPRFTEFIPRMQTLVISHSIEFLGSRNEFLKNDLWFISLVLLSQFAFSFSRLWQWHRSFFRQSVSPAHSGVSSAHTTVSSAHSLLWANTKHESCRICTKYPPTKKKRRRKGSRVRTWRRDDDVIITTGGATPTDRAATDRLTLG